MFYFVSEIIFSISFSFLIYFVFVFEYIIFVFAQFKDFMFGNISNRTKNK